MQTRGDILAITDNGPEVYDVSVAPPRQSADLTAAAQRDGASAIKRRQRKIDVVFATGMRESSSGPLLWKHMAEWMMILQRRRRR